MQYPRQVVALLTAALTTLALSGCGNGINSNTIHANTTPTQTLITDAPADQVLALSMQVDSIVLTDSAGATASILTAPVPIEVSHLDAVQEPLFPPLNIPQDTYVSATITVENPVVVYVDPTTHKPDKTSATLAASVDTVTFTTPIVVSSSSSPICFDLLVGQSVAFSTSGTTTTVTVTPTFNVTQIALAHAPTNSSNGKLQDILGQVVSVSGADLVVTPPNGTQLTLATDANTQFQGFTALSALTSGELIDADVAQQSTGALLAVRIHLAPPTAANLLLGPVTTITGSPATSFTQLVRQPVGPAVSSTSVGLTYTITVNGSTTFGLPVQATPSPSLPFTPSFNATTMIAGQNVAVGATTLSFSSATATAATVTLAPQTIDGTVASVTSIGGFTVYTVTLPAQSALATLTGQTSIVVYVTTATNVMTANPIAMGSNVRFNGLLFNDSGTLRLVAGACNDFPPPPPPQHRH